ncbi:MAG: phospho-N-acetylmuramoyl-pentapeptide-transferase [Actinobacteria bacterium]|nr:phospho-N-acetylmuramoyl-pentapeptide-transferase [Actinomycetota bacterium]
MRGILLAGAFSFLLSFLLTSSLIKVFAGRGYGQVIREDGPATHFAKRGTPTMGGVAIVVAATLGYLISHLLIGVPLTTSALLVLALVIAISFVGFLDDWLKITRQNSKGLPARMKLLGQVLVSGGFAFAATKFPDERGLTPISTNLSTVRDTSIELGVVAVIALAIVMILGTSNAVNLTDGLDGLASGAAILSFLAFVLIGVWEFGQSCALEPSLKCYEVRDPLDLAVLAAAFAGSLAGFLWWNTSPARIIMGDTGSLAIGAALAGLALTLRVQLLLVALGGLFVIITLSVIIQTGFFKISGGRRVFKMAPLHHHFELLGWSEVTVVVRFWIIAGIAMALGLGLFYADWVVG